MKRRSFFKWAAAGVAGMFGAAQAEAAPIPGKYSVPGAPDFWSDDVFRGDNVFRVPPRHMGCDLVLDQRWHPDDLAEFQYSLDSGDTFTGQPPPRAVLLTGQRRARENGVYDVVETGDARKPWRLERKTKI